jgi:Tol biopolymer transport system component
MTRAERSNPARAAALPFVCLAVSLLALPASAGGTRASSPSGHLAAGGAAIYVISPSSGAARRVHAPDHVIDFRLSRDGRRIAVAGLTGIWLMKRDGSGARRVFDGRNLTLEAGHVTWSFDGRRLAFVRGDSLFTMLTNGTGIKRLTRHADAPDWWPNGRQIVFVRNPQRSSRNGTISAVRSDTGVLRRIVASGRWYGPRVSPDGSRVAFYRNGVPGIYVASTKGGTVRLFIRNGSHPEWSPDGRYLAFTRDIRCTEGGCTSRVFIVPAAGGAARAYGPLIFDVGSLSWGR